MYSEAAKWVFFPTGSGYFRLNMLWGLPIFPQGTLRLHTNCNLNPMAECGYSEIRPSMHSRGSRVVPMSSTYYWGCGVTCRALCYMLMNTRLRLPWHQLLSHEGVPRATLSLPKEFCRGFGLTLNDSRPALFGERMHTSACVIILRHWVCDKLR